jgi:hypothetical protein
MIGENHHRFGGFAVFDMFPAGCAFYSPVRPNPLNSGIFAPCLPDVLD